MQTEETHREKKVAGPTDYLANERTFLAWIRTGIALMGFGFVIVKFALFVLQVTLALTNAPVKVMPGVKTHSGAVGIAMIAIGAVVSILAYVRYVHTEKQLKSGEYTSSRWLPALVTVCIMVVAILLLVYLLHGIAEER
ncbi:YidH family protein [Deminuibacter soli]|uniref:DUF202 domain-containing protein n=1 Tax=Deminuibacter soli TaxID=2291815 RepID=A0A3E1NCT8_9BACT|nr:DUF202 domain-containing protein [Deminuibacter soli]RFM25773.1 DUF202 domain-containing protein [Deminuibacter soli]